MRELKAPSDSHAARLRPLVDGMYGSMAVLVMASVVAGLSEAAILATVAQAAAALVNGETRVHLTLGPFHVTQSLGDLLAAAAVLAGVRLLLQAPLSTVPARFSAEVQVRMQLRLFNAFTRASWTEQSRAREGHLQELVMNQVLQAAWSTLSVTALITSVVTLAVLVASALLLNVIAAIAVLATAVVLFALLRPLNTIIVRLSRALSQAQMDMASGIGQSARLAEEAKVFGVAAAQRDQMAAYAHAARDPFYRSQMLARLSPGIYQSLIYLLVVGGLSVLYATHSAHVASLGAVVLLLIRAGSYGQQVQSLYQSLRQSLPFVERIQEVERRYDASTPITGRRRLERIDSLRFEGVGFSYTEHRPALADVDFEVRRGEAVGIIGPSGAGKSTLVQLLLQLRPPSPGRYLVNGASADEFLRDDWCEQVAYVPQEPRLLHASVAENIRFYRDLDDASVADAARQARIDSDINRWPKGYDTIVGPRADAVSGGQQQRICIARALAGQPEVLILDEPTSALDPNSESLLQESLRALKHKLTLVIVAHRMSTLDLCNRVMVILDGRLVAFDTPDQLARDNPYYRSAWALATGDSPDRAFDGSRRIEQRVGTNANGHSRRPGSPYMWVRRRGLASTDD